MACLDDNVIDLLVHGSPDPQQRAAAEAHLAGCAPCRRLISELMRDAAHAATRTIVDAERAPSTGALRLLGEGELVAERYRIVRFLAEGGMGEVYEAEDLELERKVALKTVRAEIAAEPRHVERFRREIALAHKVSHPNVCRIFDLGFHQREDRVMFLTMELLDGETLSERVRREGRFTPEAAHPIVRQLAEGLHAAHLVGVVHRDFKSQNIMLVPAGEGVRAVITDFGLAGSSLDDQAKASTMGAGLVGSPAYMAPEQVEGRAVDARADVYAFGVVLFEMLTARWPFVADTPMLTAMQRLQHDPPSPRRYVPAVPQRWADVVLRCLARDPQDRFTSALDVLVALEQRAPVAQTPWPAIAVLILLGVAVLTGGWVWTHRPVEIAPVASNALTHVPVPTMAPSDAASVSDARRVTAAKKEAPRGKPARKQPASSPVTDRWQGEIVDAPEAR